MGYQIEYDMQSIKYKKTNQKRDCIHRGVLVLLIVLGCVGIHFGSAVLESCLIGNGRELSQAVDAVTQQIQEGASLSEAVQVFCMELQG